MTFTLENDDEITVTHFDDVLKVELAGGLVICTESDQSMAVSTYEALLV